MQGPSGTRRVHCQICNASRCWFCNGRDWEEPETCDKGQWTHALGQVLIQLIHVDTLSWKPLKTINFGAEISKIKFQEVCSWDARRNAPAGHRSHHRAGIRPCSRHIWIQFALPKKWPNTESFQWLQRFCNLANIAVLVRSPLLPQPLWFWKQGKSRSGNHRFCMVLHGFALVAKTLLELGLSHVCSSSILSKKHEETSSRDRAANGTHQVCQCCECLRTLGILQVWQGCQTTGISHISAFKTDTGLASCGCCMSSNVVLITALVEVEHEWILFLAEGCFPCMINYNQEAALILQKHSESVCEIWRSHCASIAKVTTCAAAKDLVGIRSLGVGINREQHEVQQLAAACLTRAGKATSTQWKMLCQARY